MRLLAIIAVLSAAACSPPAPTGETPTQSAETPAGAHEIQWGDAPQAVRDLIATTPNTFLPERVIEQAPAADGSVIYELYSSSASETIDVSYANGQAAIMPPRH
jgi:hypothetical protein